MKTTLSSCPTSRPAAGLPALRRCLCAAALLAVVPPARAALVPVTVTVTSVLNLSAGDFGSAPDFFARIYIDGVAFTTSTIFNVNGVLPGGWTTTEYVSRAKRGGVAPIRIELWDDDSPFGNAGVDVDPAVCRASGPFGCAEVSSGPQPVDSSGVDVILDLRSGSFTPVDPTGDASSTSGTACTSGTAASSATICFSITLGTPIPEALMVSTTADLNRPFCARGDCALREAVTLAESGNIVVLPASPAPYQLTLPGTAFPPPDPSDPSQEAGSHLRVLQSPLYIRGPTAGGVAIIQQTQAGSRVFDIHGGATLVMTSVTVTGGGAGNNSSAFFGHIHGAGIHNHGKVDLRYVTIAGNRATSSTSPSVGGGGGIYNAGTGQAYLTNVTVAGNVSTYSLTGIPLGGGLAGPGAFYLRNTIVAGNTTDTGAPSNCGLGTAMNIVDQGGNLQYPGNDCGRYVTFRSPRGGSATVWWPYLQAVAANPLSPRDPATLTYAPYPTGEAVDGGIGSCGPTDQLGRPAPLDGNGDGAAVCDAGAIEHAR